MRLIDKLLSCVCCSVVDGPIGGHQLYSVTVWFKTEPEADGFSKALKEILIARCNALYGEEPLGPMQ
jgi:hypothetical protein